MFSGLPRQSGSRVTGEAITALTRSSDESSAFKVIMPVRWIITSDTTRSRRSSTPPNMSRSSVSTPPSLCSRSTAPRNSSRPDSTS